jgi:hypothetical protein
MSLATSQALDGFFKRTGTAPLMIPNIINFLDSLSTSQLIEASNTLITAYNLLTLPHPTRENKTSWIKQHYFDDASICFPKFREDDAKYQEPICFCAMGAMQYASELYGMWGRFKSAASLTGKSIHENNWDLFWTQENADAIRILFLGLDTTRAQSCLGFAHWDIYSLVAQIERWNDNMDRTAKDVQALFGRAIALVWVALMSTPQAYDPNYAQGCNYKFPNTWPIYLTYRRTLSHVETIFPGPSED